MFIISHKFSRVGKLQPLVTLTRGILMTNNTSIKIYNHFQLVNSCLSFTNEFSILFSTFNNNNINCDNNNNKDIYNS